jgi:HSP20 family protein
MRNMLDIWNPELNNPWRELVSLQRKMDRLFDGFAREDQQIDAYKNVDFVPACDVEETEKNYLVALDIPGMKKDQLQVEITGNTLTVSGEKKEEKKEGKGAQRSYERYQGRFERSFTLPELAASDKVEAEYKDGVLRISIPKSEDAKAKTRKIQISDGKSPHLPTQKGAERAA